MSGYVVYPSLLHDARYQRELHEALRYRQKIDCIFESGCASLSPALLWEIRTMKQILASSRHCLAVVMLAKICCKTLSILFSTQDVFYIKNGSLTTRRGAEYALALSTADGLQGLLALIYRVKAENPSIGVQTVCRNFDLALKRQWAFDF